MFELPNAQIFTFINVNALTRIEEKLWNFAHTHTRVCVCVCVCVCEYITFKAWKNCGILHTHTCVFVCEYITFKAMKNVYNFLRTYIVIF